MTHKIWVFERKVPSSFQTTVRAWEKWRRWHPYCAFISRGEAEAQMAIDKDDGFDHRIRVYAPRKAVQRD